MRNASDADRVEGSGWRRVAIGLGANLGDRLSSLRRATDELRSHLREISASSVYETRPRHVTDQPWFFNAAVVGLTGLAAGELLIALQDIERRLGRRRGGERYGPRALDLDLLLYEQLVIETEELQLPHPRLVDRPFVLLPLADVASDWRMPEGSRRAGAQIGELAAEAGSEGVRETDLQLLTNEE